LLLHNHDWIWDFWAVILNQQHTRLQAPSSALLDELLVDQTIFLNEFFDVRVQVRLDDIVELLHFQPQEGHEISPSDCSGAPASAVTQQQ
jgi:hypothetical protein